MTTRADPYRNFNFRLEIDGLATAGFSEVIFPESTVTVVEYREGTDTGNTARKLPGTAKYTNLTLKRGITKSTDLWEWWSSTANGTGQRRNVVVVLANEAGSEVRRWIARQTFPTRYVLSPLSARSQEIVIETLELAVESFEAEV